MTTMLSKQVLSICWWKSRSLKVLNDSTINLDESEWPSWSLKINLELFRTFTYIYRISACNSRCNNYTEYTYHVDKKGLLYIGVTYLTVLFDWGMQCNPIKALYIFLSILFVCVHRGMNMAESVYYHFFPISKLSYKLIRFILNCSIIKSDTEMGNISIKIWIVRQTHLFKTRYFSYLKYSFSH